MIAEKLNIKHDYLSRSNPYAFIYSSTKKMSLLNRFAKKKQISRKKIRGTNIGVLCMAGLFKGAT